MTSASFQIFAVSHSNFEHLHIIPWGLTGANNNVTNKYKQVNQYLNA